MEGLVLVSDTMQHDQEDAGFSWKSLLEGPIDGLIQDHPVSRPAL
jgi:hypothetical protein